MGSGWSCVVTICLCSTWSLVYQQTNLSPVVFGASKREVKQCSPVDKHFQLLLLFCLMCCYWPKSGNIVRNHKTKKEVIGLFYEQTTSKPKTFLESILLKISIPFSMFSRRFYRKCPTKTRQQSVGVGRLKIWNLENRESITK